MPENEEGPSESSSSEPSSPVESSVQKIRSFGGVFSKVSLWGECHLGCPVWSVSVSRSGILCGCDDGSIVLLNCNMDCGFRVQEAHRSAITQITWASDGLHFLTVGTDLHVRVWRMLTETAECIYSMHQISPVISACFHPMTYGASPTGLQGSPRSMSNDVPSPGVMSVCTVFVLTSDKKIGVWTDGVVEMYESLSAKDAMPMSMSAQLRPVFATASTSSAVSSRGHPTYLAIGAKNGDLLLYSFSSDSGISYESSIACHNRRGKYRDGAPAIGVQWISGSELVLSTQDNRIRLVRINSNWSGSGIKNPIKMAVVKKFKGHRSSGGEVPLAGFVHSAPFAKPVLIVGSECGRVFAWPLDPQGLSETKVESSSSILSKLWNNVRTSRARSSTDTWVAVQGPDKLTAVAPAPWIPQKGRIAGASCTVTASLDGSVKLFLAEFS